MFGSSQKDVFYAASHKIRRAALPAGLFAASFAMLVTAFVDPAPALDAPAARAPETTPLPMFKNPRAALRAGLESYHAGDAATSVAALRYAAEGGEPLAQWKLGRMYADGDGVARDEAKAYDYFSKIVDHFAEEEPDPRERSMAANAFVAVGIYLRDGLTTARIEPDLDRAFELFRYAATYFRNADAQYHLGRMYLDGQGVKRDLRQSVNWLELAARKGHPQAQAVLGRLMFNGEAGGAGQKARGLMYLTLARDAAAGGANEQWIIDSHAKALASASEADRKAAVALLEDYLRERN
ncbi:tetratricopeptide repeat protein [Methylocystis parvus]|uniref:Sel1 repeat family protein n=1 Tax=Methylocystis parvus TaxID=134 RepID=A0A6B8M756_9HYPH|nr:tetratricopeptide repeat protein [Methylocystis parvus]QGM97163.1 sel1 repeat family protein [Methylocystis parvus]WBJ98933.1 sel1 repeat family protein [Methylocystis parvus OBBP]